MEQQQKIADSILELARLKIKEGVSGLLGSNLNLDDSTNQLVSQEKFLSSISQKMVLAKMMVKGDTEDTIYLFVSLKAAIFLGGTLVMLPAQELESRVANEEFGEEDTDAFGEIANIIAGVYSTVFAERHPDKLHLLMKGLESVDPSQGDIDTLLPSQDYYLSSCSMTLDNQQLDELWVLFPAKLFKLSTEEPKGKTTDGEAQPLQAKNQLDQSVQDEQPSLTEEVDKNKASISSLILIITDTEEESKPFTKVIEENGLSAQILSLKDNIKENIPMDSVLGVFLVSEEVDEQALGAIIKIRGACGETIPLIAAGAKWTRKKVIKAVEYGVSDIILTPATSEAIKQKIDGFVN
jgi:hypothetical protein